MGCRWVRAMAALVMALPALSCAGTFAGQAKDRGNDKVVLMPATLLPWQSTGATAPDRVVLWQSGGPRAGRLERLRPGTVWGPQAIGDDTLAVVLAGRLQAKLPDGRRSLALGTEGAWRLTKGSTMTFESDPRATTLVALVQVGQAPPPSLPSRPAAVPVPVGPIRFRPVPSGDLHQALLWGDRKRAASVALTQQKAGKPAHVRNYPADTHLIVLKGTVTVLPEGRLPGTALPAGSYALLPAGVPYITTTRDKDTRWLEYHPGPVDPLLP